MSSVDGRLLPSRWTLPFGDTEPSELFGEYAALGQSLGTDAWMFGKATSREAFPDKFMPKTETISRTFDNDIVPLRYRFHENFRK